MKISACVITKNEELNIERCLGSMRGYVDEMIVADTGSTDQTKEKAAALGAKIYDFVWRDDFAAAKNFAREKATGDWIIFLDADEYFTAEGMRRAIQFMKRHHKSKFHGYLCRIFNIDVDDDNRELSSFTTVRIFRNLPHLLYRYAIHEEVYNKAGTFDLCVADEEIEIYHTGYSRHIIEQKLERNLRILLDDIEKNGEDPRHYRYLLDCYYGMGEYEQAIKYAKLHIASKQESLGSESVVYGRLVSSMLLGNMDTQETAKELRNAMEKFPLQPIFFSQYASIFEGRKDYREALRYYLQALEVYKQKEFLEADSFKSKLPMLHCSVGRIYALQNRKAQAIAHLKQALVLNRYETNALASLLFAMQGEKEADIIALLLELYEMNSRRDLSFLVNNLQKYPLNGVYAYYQKILQEKFQETVPLAKEYDLLSTGSYALLEACSAAEIAQEMRQMTLALLLMGDWKRAKSGLGYLSAAYKDIVQSYYEDAPLQLLFYEAYEEVLGLLILYGRKELGAYVKLSGRFSLDEKVKIGKLLMARRKYEEAIVLWENLTRAGDEAQRADTAALLGECFYYRKAFAKANAQFAYAAAGQALSPYLDNLYAWSREQAPESAERPGMTSIVILTRNQLDYTKLCIESIRRYTSAERYEIIVVDNHSTDGTAAWLKKQKDIRAIFNAENRGFAKGCNQGLAIADGSEILLLNNDTVVTEHWLARLQTALYSDEHIGAVGPITNYCGNFQQIHIAYQNIAEMQEFAAGHNCASDPSLWEGKMKLVGFCMLLKKSVVDRIGCLDEAFWRGNFEDDDYSYRMVQAGYRLLLCHDVFIHHFGNVTFKAEATASEEAFYRQCMDSHAEIFTEKWGFDPRYVAWCREDVIDIMDVKRENLSVLEVGCACGATLLRIKYLNGGARVYGIEVASGPAEIAGHFAEVRTEDIETAVLGYEKGQFDYILFPDVLEHLRDPQAVLRKMKPYLKPDGAVIASVPNVMHIDVVKSLLEGNWTYKEAGILDRTHLRFFTRKEIHNLLNEAGYKECFYKNILSDISPENEALIEKISQLTLTPDPREFRVYQYIVKAIAAKEEPMQSEASIQSGDTMASEEETSLAVLLRNIAREVGLGESVEEILRLRKADELDVEAVLLPAIESEEEHKTQIAVCLATSFYENGFAGDALTLLIPFYEKEPQDAELVYALGNLLRLMGERETAMKVLRDFQGKNQSIQELLRIVEKEV